MNDQTSSATEELIRVIQPSVVVAVNISTGFYSRIQRLLLFLTAGKSKQQLEEAGRMVETNTCPEGGWQEQYMTLLILCKAFEDQVEQRKLYQEVTPAELQTKIAQASA